MKRVIKTWKVRGIKPKCHYSHQYPGARRGTHSQTIEFIDAKVLKTIHKYDMDMMFEVKDKEETVFKMYKKYFNSSIDTSLKINWELDEAFI